MRGSVSFDSGSESDSLSKYRLGLVQVYSTFLIPWYWAFYLFIYFDSQLTHMSPGQAYSAGQAVLVLMYNREEVISTVQPPASTFNAHACSSTSTVPTLPSWIGYGARWTYYRSVRMRTRVTVVRASVTTRALAYDEVRATKWTYQTGLHWTRKLYNLAISLRSSLSRVIACFLSRTSKMRGHLQLTPIYVRGTRRPSPKVHKPAICWFDEHYLGVVRGVLVVRRTRGLVCSKFGAERFVLQYSLQEGT